MKRYKLIKYTSPKKPIELKHIAAKEVSFKIILYKNYFRIGVHAMRSVSTMNLTNKRKKSHANYSVITLFICVKQRYFFRETAELILVISLSIESTCIARFVF